MKILLDTHLLVCSAVDSPQLSQAARALLDDPENIVCFSAASLWELTIKRALARNGFHLDPGLLYRGLLENGYREMPITAAHALAVAALPPLHKDPFDRILLAQAVTDGLTLLTRDGGLARYPGPIRVV